jgi:hypothetical protein
VICGTRDFFEKPGLCENAGLLFPLPEIELTVSSTGCSLVGPIILQFDRNMAWVSPIWVNVTGAPRN